MTFLLSIEGVHGSGKSMVSANLSARLNGLGVRTELTNDQQSSRLGLAIRRLSLLSGFDVDPYTETLLVAAARRQTYVDVIAPNLRRGVAVITERFTDAFYAFGAARRLASSFTAAIAASIADGNVPSHTLLLDIDAQKALDRISPVRRHRVESESVDFHDALRLAYLEQAKTETHRITVIDADQPPAVVSEAALSTVLSVLRNEPTI